MDIPGFASFSDNQRRQAPPSADELLRLFECSLELLCIAGVDGYFKRVNPAFERTLGYTAEELLSRPFLDFVHPDDREKTREEAQKLAQGVPTIQFENRCRCRDGSYRWLSWNAMPQAHGEQIYAAASDVTDRKRVEERFRLLLESAPDAMVVVDRTGRIVLVNAQAETMFGYPRDELLGQSVETLVPAGLRRQHAVDRAAYSAKPWTRQMGQHPNFNAVRKDGSEFPVEIALSPIETESGVLIYAAIRNVTERLRMQMALEDSRSQLLAAQRIQEHLLPERPPVVPGYDIAGHLYPAEFAAGDHFDFLAMPDGHLGIVVADVAGHGVGPAILMASTRAYLHSLAEISGEVDQILARANAVVVAETDTELFVTALLAQLDPHARTLHYANAGHPGAMVLDRRGDLREVLASTSCPLGVLPDAQFPVGGPIALNSGDLVFFYTDGLTEAISLDNEMFGDARVLNVLAENRYRAAADIITAMHAAVMAFSGRTKLQDDVTMVVVKVDSDE